MAQWLETMPAHTKVAIGVGVAVILIATVAFAWWAMRTEYAVLFSRLTEADAAGIVNSPQGGDARQDDYDIWLGTDVLDTWIPWNRHGLCNVLYLDCHAKSVQKSDAYPAIYPGGACLTDPSFYP